MVGPVLLLLALWVLHLGEGITQDQAVKRALRRLSRWIMSQFFSVGRRRWLLALVIVVAAASYRAAADWGIAADLVVFASRRRMHSAGAGARQLVLAIRDREKRDVAGFRPT
jgi:hypothetical protein